MTRLAVLFVSEGFRKGGLLQKQDHSCGREGGAGKGNEEEEAGLQRTLHFFSFFFFTISSFPLHPSQLSQPCLLQEEVIQTPSF